MTEVSSEEQRSRRRANTLLRVETAAGRLPLIAVEGMSLTFQSSIHTQFKRVGEEQVRHKRLRFVVSFGEDGWHCASGPCHQRTDCGHVQAAEVVAIQSRYYRRIISLYEYLENGTADLSSFARVIGQAKRYAAVLGQDTEGFFAADSTTLNSSDASQRLPTGCLMLDRAATQFSFGHELRVGSLLIASRKSITQFTARGWRCNCEAAAAYGLGCHHSHVAHLLRLKWQLCRAIVGLYSTAAAQGRVIVLAHRRWHDEAATFLQALQPHHEWRQQAA